MIRANCFKDKIYLLLLLLCVKKMFLIASSMQKDGLKFQLELSNKIYLWTFFNIYGSFKTRIMLCKKMSFIVTSMQKDGFEVWTSTLTHGKLFVVFFLIFTVQSKLESNYVTFLHHSEKTIVDLILCLCHAFSFHSTVKTTHFTSILNPLFIHLLK